MNPDDRCWSRPAARSGEACLVLSLILDVPDEVHGYHFGNFPFKFFGSNILISCHNLLFYPFIVLTLNGNSVRGIMSGKVLAGDSRHFS